MRYLRILLAGALSVGIWLAGAALHPTPAAAAVFVDDVPMSTWDVNGRVIATEIVGDVVYVGGTFTAAISPAGTSVARQNLAAFSMTTGALITGWRADAGAAVRAIVSDGQSLFVGGNFGRINGVSRTRVAKLSLATGAVDPTFVASADNGVRALTVNDGDLYLGGTFLNVNGAARNRLARVDATTGALNTTFRPAASGPVYGLVNHPLQDVLYVAGPFDRLNGISRAGVGAVSTSTGATTGPAFASSARPTLALDINEDGSRLFGAGGAGANQMSAWETGTGARRWRVTVMGDNQATKYFRGTVYVGFHDGYQNDNGLKLLAIDAETGAVDPDFRPRIPGFWGVFAIDASEDGVVIGGEFTSVDGVAQRNFAIFDGGEPPPPPPPPAATVNLVDSTTQWGYWDRGTRPAGWETDGFDDSAWPRGHPQLGYGDGDETTVISFGPTAGQKYITSYFRTRFTQTGDPDSVQLSLIADDGAVVYVNGVEVVRDNMPTGVITNTTRASTGRSGGAENASRDFVIDADLLREGTNTIAVEVHQDRPDSSDLSFDVWLSATYPA
jgi:hypothetical protein